MKLLALITVSALIIVGYAGADETTAPSLNHSVKFEIGKAAFSSGDNITITALHGTHGKIETDGMYRVEGSYTLTSHDQASLGFFNTSEIKTPTPIDSQQQMKITKGKGTFSLVITLHERGYLHVSFYPKDGGEAFGGVYLGQGQSVLRAK